MCEHGHVFLWLRNLIDYTGEFYDDDGYGNDDDGGGGGGGGDDDDDDDDDDYIEVLVIILDIITSLSFLTYNFNIFCNRKSTSRDKKSICERLDLGRYLEFLRSDFSADIL